MLMPGRPLTVQAYVQESFILLVRDSGYRKILPKLTSFKNGMPRRRRQRLGWKLHNLAAMPLRALRSQEHAVMTYKKRFL